MLSQSALLSICHYLPLGRHSLLGPAYHQCLAMDGLSPRAHTVSQPMLETLGNMMKSSFERQVPTSLLFSLLVIWMNGCVLFCLING